MALLSIKKIIDRRLQVSTICNFSVLRINLNIQKSVNLNMATLIVHPENKEQLNALKAFMKALKISFEEEKDKYDPAFVDMILKGEEEIKAGKGIKVDTDNLWK
jgi:hypothetical protein